MRPRRSTSCLEYHQQYLHKNPMGYCGTGVSCPGGITSTD
jgi:peptide methionine sulfoxide reductase MsrA